MISRNAWHDQDQFNRLFREPSETTEDRVALTKDMVLHMISECYDLLKCTAWKTHRRVDVPFNPRQVEIELIDILKYWVTIAQGWGISFDRIEEVYWEKSAVCRQRHSEEWITRFDQPCAVIDLDNVLCDYGKGFASWLHDREYIADHVYEQLCTQRAWIDASTVGISAEYFASVKHTMRISGAKSTFPMMPHARQFVQWVWDIGLQPIIVTSRPIDRYPSMLVDTLTWLKTSDIRVAGVWWAQHKGHTLAQRQLTKQVRFAVDDDFTYVTQYAADHIPTYYIRHVAPHGNTYDLPPGVTAVTSLQDIITHYTGGQQ